MRSSSGFLLGLFAVMFLGVLTSPAQPIGHTYVAGDTWYDLQHNGSTGKSIAMDDSGRVHIVWTNGFNDGMIRHVFYNVWNPAMSQFPDSNGLMLDNSLRAGFASIALAMRGCLVIAFSQLLQNTTHISLSLCGLMLVELPLTGPFTPTSPLISIHRDSTLLVLSALASGPSPSLPASTSSA